MTVVEEIADKSARLPDFRQQEVLDFVEFVSQRCSNATLVSNNQNVTRRRSILGRLANSGRSIGEEEIAHARREMWNSFPREGLR
jgi:hypothetical protein